MPKRGWVSISNRFGSSWRQALAWPAASACGLIQFWPDEGRYRMIEVKGPGDRLQDNQLRWLEFCREHGLPVDVCHVRWDNAAS